MRGFAPREMKMGVTSAILSAPRVCKEVVVSLVLRAREGVWPEHLFSTTHCRPRRDVGEHAEET